MDKIIFLVFIILLFLIIVVYGIYKGVRAQFKSPLMRNDGIWNRSGTCEKKNSEKEGKIFINGELWNATWEDEIMEGDKVVVVEVRDNVLFVKKDLDN
jgi:membrane protein implicated in regulation of membrane protease activity